MLIATMDLDQVVARAGELYSLPRVAAEVLELTSSPSIDARRLKQCLERDPALVGKLLRVVNSSLFGLSREVADLHQALGLLGIKPLKLLVLGFSLPDALFAGLAGDVLSRYWQHTLVRAVAAREISQALRRSSGDEAFLAGLLRDLGLLVLLREAGTPYVQFLERMHAEGADAALVEREVLGFNRVDLTMRLLAHWNLPQGIVAAAGELDDTDLIGSSSEAQHGAALIVQLAEKIAMLLADRRTDMLRDVVDEAKRQGLAYTDLVSLLRELQAKVEQLAGVLTLELPQGRDYAAVLIESQRQLARISEEAVEELIRGESIPRERLTELLALGESRSLAIAAMRAKPRDASRSGIRENSDSFAPTEFSRIPLPDSCDRSRSPHAEREGYNETSPAIDPGVLGWLAEAVARSRELRVPLALLLVELDGYPEIVFLSGVERARHLLDQVGAECRSLDHAELRCVPAADARLAVILSDCDRATAVRLSQHLLAAVQGWSQATTSHPRPIRLSIAVAATHLPARNFAPVALIEAADRCLFAARAGGGNCIKSIEVA